MTEEIREMNMNPWEQGITWFWYNDAEIFQFTQEDFDRKAKDLADKGITIVLTFSFTHFRLGFYPYWNEINECIRKIVLACHKYGIRVVEHHSAHLTHFLRTKKGWSRFGESMLSYANGESSYDNWYKTLAFLTADFMIDGKDIRDFVQIDGRTGKAAENTYGAYSMCFNNPDYREVYFNYLKDVVATGIDGIMNDDIQFFGERNACACVHCRKLFYEQTGYTLPDPEHWSEFFDNYDDPAYIAWKKFKFESTTRMYRDLTAHYEKLGVKLLRPNYCSDILKHNPTCYSFDRCTDLWDFIFQENCFSAVMKESYMDFMTEAIHRYAAGKRHGVPSMSMFYPDRPDSAYFAWALSRSWGQLYTGTCEGFDITAYEKPYRDFEKKYMQYYTAPEKYADLSFYFSRKTRDYMEDAFPRYTRKSMAGMQAAYVSNLCVDMVMEEDTLEELCSHPLIVVSHVPMMSDDELTKLSSYVKLGGKLVILGEFAVRNDDGSPRDRDEIASLLGVAVRVNETVCLGNGQVMYFDYENPEDEYQPTIWVGRKGRSMTPDNAVPSKWEMQKNGTGALLRKVVDTPYVTVSCANNRVISSMYGVEDAQVIHLVNLAGTVSEAAKPVSHDDIIPNFAEGAPKLPEMNLKVKLPENVTVSNVLDFAITAGFAEIYVPDGIFSAYAMIVLD